MSDYQDSSKRVRVFGKIAGLALVIFNLLYLLRLWIWLAKYYLKEGFEASEILRLFVFPIPFSIFAGYCLVVACRLYKGLTKESLRNFCFVSSLIVYLMLAPIVRSALEPDRSTSDTGMWVLSNILCIIAAGLFYWLTKKYLTRWLGFDTSIDWQRRRQAAKRFFGLTTFFVYSLFGHFAESLEEAYDVDPHHWPFGVLLLLPVILAFIFYRLSLRIAMYGCPKRQGQTSEVAEASLPND